MKISITKVLLLAFTQLTLLCIFYTRLYSQCNPGILKIPDELVKNRLNGEGNYYGHPYTMFNKRNVNFNLLSEIENIRKQILIDKSSSGFNNLYEIYSKVFFLANSPRPAEVNATAISPLAIWAKYNAFVLLVGLDTAGNPINTERYLNNVYAAFKHMNYDGADDKDKVIVFAKSALCWIQAYDLYKTALRMADANLSSDFDRNRSDSGPRDKMRIMAFNTLKSYL